MEFQKSKEYLDVQKTTTVAIERKYDRQHVKYPCHKLQGYI